MTGKPGSTQSGKITVTNVGTKPLTVAAGTRGYTALSGSQQTVPFDSTTLPTFVYYNGQTWAFKEVTFDVPSGTQRLLARMAFQATGPLDIVRMTLLDPSGTFIANSRPQGGTATANYANVDVRNPTPGRWTAVLYSVAGRPATTAHRSSCAPIRSGRCRSVKSARRRSPSRRARAARSASRSGCRPTAATPTTP